MNRISKPPEVRKQEILDTSMKLFYEKGYESTSMADIARELNIVQGLCYRYFPSKQILFDTAMNQYVVICCSNFVKIIHDHRKSISERFDSTAKLMENEEKINKYHNFYHKPGNEAMHEMLSIKMCKYMLPHVIKELENLSNEGTISIEKPELAAKFLLYGQMGLLQDDKEPLSVRIKFMRTYIEKLFNLNND
ncbi:MAG: helix-turn-helix domain containing protein [Clostridium sp.]|nr:helix-turn-helix domain containing protein [Clostridium sp.]